MRRSVWLWAGLVGLYLEFRLWYDGGGGPLTPAEVTTYLARFEARGVEPARLERLREFLAGDDGGDFVIANFIRFRDDPGAQADLDRYMAHMYPELFKRACHPVLAGPVVGAALDIWGIEDAELWSLVGLVRYRSRRDMLEISSNPAFADAHRFKQSAMEQTIAIPLEPFLNLASPRVWVGVALVAAGALLQSVFSRSASGDRGAS